MTLMYYHNSILILISVASVMMKTGSLVVTISRTSSMQRPMRFRQQSKLRLAVPTAPVLSKDIQFPQHFLSLPYFRG